MLTYKTSSHSLALYSISLLSVCCLALGCGNPTTGANSPTTVTVKIGNNADGGDEVTDPSNDTIAEGFGSITGKVVFKGADPNLAPQFKQGAGNVPNPNICAAVDMPNEKMVVGEGGGVANVFIYLKDRPKGAPKAKPPAEPLKFDQKYCRFEPHALFIQADRPLQITNSDPINHNTHTLPSRNAGFNNSIPQGAEGTTISYSKSEAEPFKVICDIHSWMSAYQLPLDHPFAAVTDANGNFEIKDLPAGKHEFRVWHEGIGTGGDYLNRKLVVTVKANEVTDVPIDYPADQFTAQGNGKGPKQVLLSTLLNQ